MMDQTALTDFETAVKEVEVEAAKPYEMGEMDLRLDIASREPDLARIAKHILQMSVFHAGNFRRANYVKLAYLGRFFLTETTARNPIGVTSAARSILEVHAFLRWVQSELARIAGGPPQEWRSRGNAFFDVLIRARFGSSNPPIVEALTKAGVPDKLRHPYRVGECIKALARIPQFAWANDHYAFLCDWVHANQSSQTASTAGSRVGNTMQVGETTVWLTDDTTVLRHEYGAPLAIDYVMERTLVRARDGFFDGLAAVRETTDSPFTEDEVMRLTGTPHGVRIIPPSRRPHA